MANKIIACTHVFITGQVQGVGFRFYTKGQADKLGLCGWVKNTSDGRVEAVFEGNKERVEEMITWCHEGSPSAQVKRVEFTWKEPGNLDSFKVYK